MDRVYSFDNPEGKLNQINAKFSLDSYWNNKAGEAFFDDTSRTAVIFNIETSQYVILGCCETSFGRFICSSKQ